MFYCQPKQLVIRYYIIFKRSVVGQHIAARLISWDHRQDWNIEEKEEIVMIIKHIKADLWINIYLMSKIDGIR